MVENSDSHEQLPSKQEQLATIPSPRDIVAHLDCSVIGQGRAKRTLAIALSNHFIRLPDAVDRGTGARGLRAVVEAVLEPVLFDPEPWATCVVAEETVRGGEIGKLDFFG